MIRALVDRMAGPLAAASSVEMAATMTIHCHLQLLAVDYDDDNDGGKYAEFVVVGRMILQQDHDDSSNDDDCT